MPDFVRVKAKDTGHKLSIVKSAAEADQASAEPAYQILKQDAVDHNGWPLPPEFPDSPAPSGQKATDNTKES